MEHDKSSLTLYILPPCSRSILPPCSSSILPPVIHYIAILPPVHTFYIATLFTHCHPVHTLYCHPVHALYCHPVHTLPPCSHIATLFAHYIATLFTLYIATLFTCSILPLCSHNPGIQTGVVSPGISRANNFPFSPETEAEFGGLKQNFQ